MRAGSDVGKTRIDQRLVRCDANWVAMARSRVDAPER